MIETFLFSKIVDMSSLYEGISIPVAFQPVLFKQLGFTLKHGEKKAVMIRLQEYTYEDAQVINQRYDVKKYPNNKDIVQIRYSKNSLLAQKIREIFSLSTTIVEDFISSRTNSTQRLVIPENSREYISLYANSSGLRFDCIPRNQAHSFPATYDFGEGLPQRRDLLTSAFQRSANLVVQAKQRAKGICQLCGKVGPFNDNEGNPFLEVHHIVWLSRGGSDTITNVVALCPNCHAKMHVIDDAFDVSYLKKKAQSV